MIDFVFKTTNGIPIGDKLKMKAPIELKNNFINSYARVKDKGKLSLSAWEPYHANPKLYNVTRNHIAGWNPLQLTFPPHYCIMWGRELQARQCSLCTPLCPYLRNDQEEDDNERCHAFFYAPKHDIQAAHT